MQLKHKLMPIFAQESYFLVYIALISVLIIDNQMWSQINSLLRELSFPNFDFRAVISIIINLFFYENYEKENDFFEISRKTDKKILIITSTVLVFVILLGRFIFDYYWLINLSVALGISNIIAGIMAQQQRQCLQIEKHNQIILK